jgi:hypothetical protein
MKRQVNLIGETVLDVTPLQSSYWYILIIYAAAADQDCGGPRVAERDAGGAAARAYLI